MSKLASKIAKTTPSAAQTVRRGPQNKCFPLYGVGDIDDWDAMEERRLDGGLAWAEVQVYLDGLLDITDPLLLDKFKHHWRRFCRCWPDEHRRGR